MCVSPLPSAPLFILITHRNLVEVEERESGVQGEKKVKNAIYQEHFTQELRFGSICVSHWKCHLTKGVVDNTTARTYAERKLEGEYR